MIHPNPITPAQYYMSRSAEEKQKFLRQYGQCYKLVIHQFYKFLNREPGHPIAIIPNSFNEKIYHLIKKRLNKKLFKKTGWHVTYSYPSFDPNIVFKLV